MHEKKNTIVCFGEVLWDVYADGKKLGGAPFNVAAHLHQLGSESHMISKVGNDDLGKEILKSVAAQSISTRYTLIDQEYHTGMVQVTLDDQGKPSYDIKQPAAWDRLLLTEQNQIIVREAAALVYGSLACRSDQNLETLLTLTEVSKLNICDLNIRLDYYSESLISTLLHRADILKINDEEAHLLMQIYGIEKQDFYATITQKFGIGIIIQTLGADGAEVYSDSKVYHSKGFEVEVLDTVGSGDAFLAGFIHHYLRGENF